MRHHASLRRLPQIECLEVRDTPGNFFGDLLGRVEVLTYYGVRAVKGALEHGPSEHAQHPKRLQQQRAHAIALAHANEGAVPTLVPPVAPAQTEPLLTLRRSASLLKPL